MIGVPRSDNAMSDMAAIMARVRKMSDSQLADILAGKDVSVPQFAAMTEAMGRRQLRDAVKGAEAQQQAQQPSVKDQLMMADAQEAGLAALPAPNMTDIDMASGGIVAFEGGGDVYNRWKALASDEGENINQLLDPIYGFFTNRYGKEAKARREEREKQAALSSIANTAFYDDTIDPNVKQRDPNAPAPDTAANTTTPAANAAKPNAPASVADSKYKFERRANPFEGMQAKATDVEKLRSQGLGEGLMKLSRSLLTTPGMKGVGEGIGALGEQGAITRKEIAGLEKDARDYNFNIARAREAADQGNDELALKYQQAADLNRYHMAMANKPGSGLELLNALKDPNNMKIFQQMQAVKKPTDVVSKEKALANWKNVPPKEKHDKYGDDFNNYYLYVNNQLLTDTMPTGGDVLGKI